MGIPVAARQPLMAQHQPPASASDWAAYCTATAIRTAFDWLAGFTQPPITEEKWLRRIIFLETTTCPIFMPLQRCF